MIDKSFIDRVAELGQVEMIEIGERQYASKNIFPVKPPIVPAFALHTLTGIAHYLKENPDKIDMDTIIVHVDSHNSVSVFSKLADEWQQRHCYLSASHEPKAFPFGRSMPVEEFIVALQTYFQKNDHIDAMTKIVGNLSATTSLKTIDNGISFMEITQPASQFLFRMNQERGISCALHEADGGNWQLEAVNGIAVWLKDNLPNDVVIIA
jgi:hypothetical protein